MSAEESTLSTTETAAEWFTHNCCTRAPWPGTPGYLFRYGGPVSYLAVYQLAMPFLLETVSRTSEVVELQLAVGDTFLVSEASFVYISIFSTFQKVDLQPYN